MSKIPLITREDIPVEKQYIYDTIAGTRGSVLNVFRTLLNSVDAAEAVANVGAYIRYKSPLDPAIRETTILATARELNVPYEWAHHEPVARESGVREEVIEAIRSGKAPMGLPPKEGVFIQAAKELVHEGSLRDATFQAITHLIGTAQTIDLIILVGYYSMLGTILTVFDVELDDGTRANLPNI